MNTRAFAPFVSNAHKYVPYINSLGAYDIINPRTGRVITTHDTIEGAMRTISKLLQADEAFSRSN